MLRIYQSDILKRIAEAFMTHRSVMVQMPTGTGKTVVLANVIKSLIPTPSQKDVGSDMSLWQRKGGEVILIVAHRRELIDQIKETVRRIGIDDKIIVVESIQTISRRIDSLAFTPYLVVIDEAHHALAKTYRMMWETWREAKFLGLTATPCRLSGQGFTDLFDTLVQSWSIGRFIKEGWLSLFDYYSIKPDGEEQKLINSLGKRGADGDYQVKELNAVLNHRPSIERLYNSMMRYALDKKGIVYAINIDHARNIARYYLEHGANAVAIDSKTPAEVRRQTVEDFRTGRIRVMVSVDLFSEGFDCPDVEFIQLARPTLSLAKYLQMVGRGLRKSESKESCVMIDNVGLYRMFGLPVAEHEWQAMFDGTISGKGFVLKNDTGLDNIVSMNLKYSPTTDTNLDEVISHETLLEQLKNGSLPTVNIGVEHSLRAFQDRSSGLYGLKNDSMVVAKPQYQEVLDLRDGKAAVRLEDKRTAIVDRDGNITTMMKRYAAIKLQSNDIVYARFADGTREYIDMRNGIAYKHRPTIVKFGDVEMLKVNGLYYCRTKTPHRKGFNDKKCSFVNREFYLEIFTHNDTEWKKEFENNNNDYSWQNVALLATDDSDWFFNVHNLADGSILVSDKHGRYYHVENGKEKRYIGNKNNIEEQEMLSAAKEKLQKEAKTKKKKEKEEKRMEQLKAMQKTEPFLSGIKWGLMLGDKVIVPPIYRTITPAVGNYRAVEVSPRQWGVILLNGRIVLEPKYEAVKLNSDGTADVTIYRGRTINMKLKEG